MIIDAHHHVWRLSHTPWLQGPMQPRIFGAYDALRRDYTMEEFRADSAPEGVTQSVYVQVNVAPGAEIEEVAWVASIPGGPAAITGFADLAAPDVARVLDAQIAAGPLRGVRQQLHWHANPQYRFAARANLFDDPAWRAGLHEVARRGLLFELQVFASQMAGTARLVAAFPDVTFVLLHAGMLEDRSPQGWSEWRAGMRLLAAQPNVCVKLSGLGTFLRRCDAAEWSPVVRETVELFGPDRCLFGSNFPIEKLWCSYAALMDAMRECLAPYGAAEQRAIWHDTAARLYLKPA